jgi:16S rRNA processing protein RimM
MPLVRVGRLLKPHGIHGQVKCALTTDHPELLAGRQGYWLFDERSKELLPLRGVEIEYTPGVDSFFLHAAGWAAPEPLQGYNGCALLYYARRGELPREAGEVYYFELAGLEARDTSGAVLGRVRDVIETGAGIVLEVDSAPPRLIPFTARDVPEVNLEGGYLVTSYGAGGFEDVR